MIWSCSRVIGNDISLNKVIVGGVGFNENGESESDLVGGFDSQDWVLVVLQYENRISSLSQILLSLLARY